MPNTFDGIVLLGWMEKSEAISYLLEHCCFDPQLTNQQAEELWERFRQTVEQLPERNANSPVRRPVPQSSQAWVNQFMGAFRGPEVLDVINVDPRELAIYQFYVAVDRSDDHARNLGKNRWTEACL